MNKKNARKDLYIQIGERQISYSPELKKSIDIEILLLNLLLFTVIVLYGLNYISWSIFLLLFYALAMRIFIGNHDRMHANHKNRLPRFFEVISEGLAVVVTPWDEPYNSIRKKHIKHHSTHIHSPEFDTRKDPHSVYELGGLFRVFFSCLFYEEVQLFLDIRNDNLTKDRLYRLLIYIPLQIIFIASFGLDKFLVVFLAMRLVGFSAWFVFSWVIHQPIIYKFGFSKQVPRLFKWTFALFHGRRVTEGCIYHATHHSWPSIPYNQLSKFDATILSNSNSA